MKRLLGLLSAFGLLAFAASAGNAPGQPGGQPGAQPGIEPQRPGTYAFTVGTVRVTALSDGTVPIDLHQILRNTTPERTDGLLAESFLSNPYEASVNAFLLEIGDRRVLVDTGAGDLFGPDAGGRLGEALAAAGVRPEAIDDILITHVHSDHSGGLVKNGRMLFPNATVHAGEPDVDFFLDRRNAARTGYDTRYFAEAEATLKPYADAGRVKPFSEAGEVVPGVRAELHPGHTPGAAFYTLASGGERITFIGDTIHVGAVQFPDPGVTVTFDQDAEAARSVREAAFKAFAADATLLAAPHLPFPGVGRIRAEGAGYRWLPVEYSDRRAGGATPELDRVPTPQDAP